MYKYTKIAACMAATFALTACLEVEDKNNDKLTAQLEAQNKILQAQLDNTKEQQELQKAPYTMKAQVKALSDDVNISDAKVSLYYNGEWHDAVNVEADGSISIDKLPDSNNFAVKVFSDSDAFVKRFFTFSTQWSNGPKTLNLGHFEVSKAHTVSFEVHDIQNGQPVTDLDFFIPAVPTEYSSDEIKFVLAQENNKAVFNTETNRYDIKLARDLDEKLQLTTDLDNDNIDDVLFASDYYESTNQLSTTLLQNDTILYVNKTLSEEYKIELLLTDELGNTLTDAVAIAPNNDYGHKQFVFDSEKGTVSLDANYRGTLQINIPTFTQGDKTFESASIFVNEAENRENAYQVSSNNTIDDFYTSLSLNNGTLSLVLQLKEQTQIESRIELVSSKSTFNQLSPEGQFFFNTPISLESSELSLTANNVLTVTPGNADQNDDPQNGYTEVKFVDKALEVTPSLSLNDTLLTIIPKSQLLESTSYTYRVNKLTNTNTNQVDSLSIQESFSLQPEQAFTPSLLIADNVNFRVNGQLQKAVNTAGEAAGSNSSVSNQLLCLILPKGSELSSFRAEVVIVEANATTYTEFNSGTFYNFNPTIAVNVADNETIVDEHGNHNTWNYRTGLSVTSGPYNRSCINLRDSNYNSISFADHTSANENSITLDVTYQVSWQDAPKTEQVKLYIK